MPLDLPTSSKELTQRSKTDFQRQVTESNPFLRNSFIAALLTANANRVFDQYLTLEQAIAETFPSTATGDFLTNVHAPIWGVARNPAIGSSGNVVATGTLSTTIPAGSLLQNSEGAIYETSVAVNISETVQTVSLTRSGFTVTATALVAHNLSSAVSVVIQGAEQGAYNGTFVITPTSPTEFTYEIATQPATPATTLTVIEAVFTSALVPVTSQGFGQDTNVDPDAELSFTVIIAGVDSEARADQEGVLGGTDIESDADLRERLLDRIANPVANFNVGQVEFEARKVPGVTRVFVFPIEPVPGFASVYFVRDGDENIIPDASSIQAVEDSIQTIRPVDMAADRLIVSGPTPINADGQTSPQDFVFRSISPDTPTMRTAIEDNLTEFFRTGVTVAEDVIEDAYRAAIIRTIDTTTGDALLTFDLEGPQGLITVGTGQLVILGGVNFP